MKSAVLAMAVAGVELHLSASRVDRILAQLRYRYYKKGYDFDSD